MYQSRIFSLIYEKTNYLSLLGSLLQNNVIALANLNHIVSKGNFFEGG